MNPTQLADVLRPEARAICHDMRHYIRKSVPVAERAVIGLLWGPILNLILPLLIRIILELFIKRYRLAAIAGLDYYCANITRDWEPEVLARVQELRSLFATSEKDFLPMVVTEQEKARDGSVWE